MFDDTFFGRYHLPPPGLHPIRTILDLGSNIGLTIAHYAVLFPQARILGIELDSDNFALCQKNIAPFGARCEVIHGAVWTSEGEVDYEGTAHWGFHVTRCAQAGCGVRSATIRQLLDRCGDPVVDFVKMDVEGAERALLETAGNWMSKVRCLKVEIHEPFTVAECLARLRSDGFECSRDVAHPACVVAWNQHAGD